MSNQGIWGGGSRDLYQRNVAQPKNGLFTPLKVWFSRYRTTFLWWWDQLPDSTDDLLDDSKRTRTPAVPSTTISGALT